MMKAKCSQFVNNLDSLFSCVINFQRICKNVSGMAFCINDAVSPSTMVYKFA